MTAQQVNNLPIGVMLEWFTEYGEQVLWFSKNKPEQLIEFIYE